MRISTMIRISGAATADGAVGGAVAGLVSVTDVHGFPGGVSVKSRGPTEILRAIHGPLDLLSSESSIGH